MVRFHGERTLFGPEPLVASVANSAPDEEYFWTVLESLFATYTLPSASSAIPLGPCIDPEIFPRTAPVAEMCSARLSFVSAIQYVPSGASAVWCGHPSDVPEGRITLIRVSDGVNR